MLLGAVLYLSQLKAQPDIVACASFYERGSTKVVRSLYLMNGTRKTILRTPDEPFAAQWSGKNRIVWLSDKGIWSSKLTPWKPVLIQKTAGATFVESRWRDQAPGVTQIEINDIAVTVDPDTGQKRILVGEEVRNSVDIDVDTVTDVEDLNGGVLRLQLYRPVEFIPVSNSVVAQDDALKAWYSKDRKRLYLLTGTHSSSSGSVNSLAIFESDRQPRNLFVGANCFEFSDERPFFAYCTNRTISQNGKKKVWTSELHVGNRQTGDDQALLKGLVWVTSVSIRP